MSLSIHSELIKATKNGEVYEVASLLARNDKVLNINYQDENGGTSLRIACGNGCEDIAKILIDAGADVNIVDNGGWSPLYAAALINGVRIVEQLLDAKADVNHQTNEGATALYIAALKGHYEVVQILLKYNADVHLADMNGATPLHMISEHPNAEVAQLLLDAGADVNAANKYGWTPTHDSAQDNNIDAVALFINKGASVDIVDQDGWTPLYIAAQNGHAHMVQVLAESGHANCNSCDKEGNTPLIVASRCGHVEVVDVLMELGADVDLRNDEGESAIDVAVLDEVKLLFKYFNLATAAANRVVLSQSNSLMSTPQRSFSANSAANTPFSASQRNAPKAENHSTRKSTSSRRRSSVGTANAVAGADAPEVTGNRRRSSLNGDRDLNHRVTKLEQLLGTHKDATQAKLAKLEHKMISLQEELLKRKRLLAAGDINSPWAVMTVFLGPIGGSSTDQGIITELQLVGAAVLFMIMFYSTFSIVSMLGIV